MNADSTSESREALSRPARCRRAGALWLGLALALQPTAAHADIEAAEDIEAVIALKPSEPTGQFPEDGEDNRLAPNYTFTVDVRITEQEQIGNVMWRRHGPVTVSTGIPDPNLFWSALAGTTIYSITNTAANAGLAAIEVSCAWRRQGGGGGGGGGPALEIDGLASAEIDLLDSVIHWEFGVRVAAAADGEQALTFSYHLLDEAGRGLERWHADGYSPDNPDPGHVGWHFDEEAGAAEWERKVEVRSWGEAARAEIRVDYNDGSSQHRVSEGHDLTFFTARLKVEGDGVLDAEQVTLGKALRISAEIVPESFDPELYRYQIRYKDQENVNYSPLQSGQEDSYDDFARIAGFFDLRLVIHYNDDLDVYPTETAPMEARFPSYAEIVAVEELSTHFDSLWQTTLEKTSDGERFEHGCWIQYDSSTLEWVIGDEIEGPPTPNNQGAKIYPGDTPDDEPDDLTLLDPAMDGAVYTVAFFHTHTPVTFREGEPPFRRVGPSDADKDFHDGCKVPGVVYDYLPGPGRTDRVEWGHPKDSPATLYKVPSYDRRPTPVVP